MRNQAAWILFAALLIFCAAMLGGCSAHDESDAAQSAPDLSVNISVPYATTTPTAVPEDPDQPFSFDANGRVTVLNERWIDEGFVSATSDTEEQTGGYTQLRLGDQGQRVQQLQMRLRELGYYPGDISGVFDTLTEQAVQLFELTYGTMQTGIATPSLQEMLFAETAPAYSAQSYAAALNGNFSELQLGASGSNVLALQMRLRELGFPISHITGYYDQETAAAVSAFFQVYGNAPNSVATVSMQGELFTVDPRTYSGATLAPTQTQTPSGEQTLSEGNIGSTVERIQQRLIELGYMQGVASGTFDAATTEAVKAFQHVVGVSEDGVVTYGLYTQLIASDAPAYGSPEAEAIRQGGYTLLQEGDSGEAVTRLQTRLVELGYANGTPNGRYASATVSAVRLFQRAAGQEETGVATAALQALLYSADAPAYTASTQTATGDRYYPYNLALTDLSEGSSGELVSYLQTRLAELGYFSGTVDGQYGSATATAVRAVQAAMGIEQTGAASASFQEHVYSEATPPAGVSMYDSTQSFSTLQMGDSDEDGGTMGPVESLQKQLWELGYLDREAVRGTEGEFGEATRNAVIAAQQAMQYVRADGVASPEFQAFIFSRYCGMIRK